MLFLLLPVLGGLAGIGVTLIFRLHAATAAAAAAVTPTLLFQAYAAYRLGGEGFRHPGLWMLSAMWVMFVAAGYVAARFIIRRQ